MKRSNFTLFEMLLVMMLIAVITSSISIAYPKMRKKEIFEASVKKMEVKLQTAFELMIDYDTDVMMAFESKENDTVCTLHPIKTVPPKILKAINRDSLLKEVKTVHFSGKMPLYFHANGSTPIGTLTLEGPRTLFLHLKGFPAATLKGNYEIKMPEKMPYPQEILSPT